MSVSTITLTSKGQGTFTKDVREALGVSYGDKVDFVIENDKVYVQKHEPLSDFQLKARQYAQKHQPHASNEVDDVWLNDKWEEL